MRGLLTLGLMIIQICKTCRREATGIVQLAESMETTREKATYDNHHRRLGDGVIRIPDEALQELELDVGEAVYLIEDFFGNTRCLALSKTPQIADRID